MKKNKETLSDKMLDQFLSETNNQTPQFEKENQILEPLLEEIDLIRNEGIRNFTRSVLMKAEIFWISPSVNNKEAHPPDEYSVGGNVLHTKRVVRICHLLAQAHMIEQSEYNLLIAAALLHDVTKFIEDEDGSFMYDYFHPYTVDKFVHDVKQTDELRGSENESTALYIQEAEVSKILRIIRCHLGIWGAIPETFPVDDLEMILHLADLIASKLHWVVDGEHMVEDRWKY